MNIFEIHDKSRAVTVQNMVNPAGWGDIVGSIVDTAGYEAIELLYRANSTDENIPIVLHESDDPGMAGATQVSADEQLGPSILTPTILLVRVGYIGKKRYIQSTLQTGTATAIALFSNALLLNALHQPTNDQPST